MVNSAPCAVYSQEGDTVPIAQEDGCVSGPVRTGVEYFTLSGIRSPDHPNHRESQYRLRCPLRRAKIKTIMNELNYLRAMEDKSPADVTPSYLLRASWFWGQMVAGNTTCLRQIRTGHR